eukprot:GDKK01033026.1.p1 GENE.GDKK01033026.1~~GDKK01033026.1.p1  ORF type:complete len:474 (+),score=-4.53 GDKK01033026.1:194-1615(+)
MTREGDNTKGRFGRNATTALNHLNQCHHVTPNSPAQPRPREPDEMTKYERHLFIKSVVERGLGYNIFADNRFTAGLKLKLNPKSIIEEIDATSKVSLQQMGKAIRTAGGQVSIVFDLGTIDKIQTMNLLVNHVGLKTCWLIGSIDLPGSTAEAISKAIRHCLRRLRKYVREEQVPIAGIVCDNGANVRRAAELLREHEEKESPTAPVTRPYKDILLFNCACHILNLISIDVDSALTSELNMEKDDEFLQKNDIINRIVPTRWWCKMKEYEAVVNSQAKQAKLLEFPEGHDIFERIREYTTRTSELRTLGRVLERDSSNCVVAVSVLLYLIRSTDPTVQLAALNRYLKWYAPSEVPLLIAVLSSATLPSLHTMRDNQQFRDAISAVVLKLLSAPAAAGATAWSKWYSGNHDAFNSAPSEFKLHWIHAIIKIFFSHIFGFFWPCITQNKPPTYFFETLLPFSTLFIGMCCRITFP